QGGCRHRYTTSRLDRRNIAPIAGGGPTSNRWPAGRRRVRLWSGTGTKGASMDWGALSRAERDAAYNNTAAVADSGRLSDARNAASTAFRAADPGTLDLAYGPRERNRWDLFPAADPGAPCLVFIHGGYWQRNSREGFSVLAEGVKAHGWAAALPGYTLAADASLSGIVAEIS